MIAQAATSTKAMASTTSTIGFVRNFQIFCQLPPLLVVIDRPRQAAILTASACAGFRQIVTVYDWSDGLHSCNFNAQGQFQCLSHDRQGPDPLAGEDEERVGHR